MGLLGKLMGSDGGSGQAAAAAEASRVQKEMYEQTRKDLGGYRGLGDQGVRDLSSQMNVHTKTFGAEDFKKDPGYDFRMQQGQQALERSASARGGLMGGATMKALARYGQDYGSNEYGKARDRFNQDRDQRYGKMRDLVGIGQSAATQTGNAGQQYAAQHGQNLMGAANARAAASAAEGGALMGLVGQGLGAAGAAGGLGKFFSSDRRLKTNIVELSTSLYKDVPTYSYEYKDSKHGVGTHIGVMAQDLLKSNSDHPAVLKFDGHYMVDYSKVERA